LEKLKKMRLKKKAEIGETLSWVVATIIIVVMLIISGFVVSVLKERSYKDISLTDTSDLLASKSLTAYLLSETDSGEKVFERIKNKEELDNYTGNLAVNIFKELYEGEYPFNIWLGINFEGIGVRKNSYFGAMPIGMRGGDISFKDVEFFSQKIQLNNDKWIELILMNK
jgi:hypothetical protein